MSGARHDDTHDCLQELALLRAIVSAAPLVIYAKGLDHRFVLSNRRHAELVGRPAADILGSTDSELFGEEGSSVENATKTVLEDGEPSIEEFPLTLPEGERVFHETIFRLTDDEGGAIGVGGIATDITRRHELEVEVRAQNHQLESALENLGRAQEAAFQHQKLAALGSLVAGLSHEVNTPLAVTGMSLTLIREAVDTLTSVLAELREPNETANEVLDQIREATELAEVQMARTGELMRSFREVTVDREHVETRRTTLSDWLQLATQTLQPVCRRNGVQLHTHLDGDCELFLAVGAMHQVLTNLVTNACVHAFEGHDGPRDVWVDLAATPTGLTLIVDDNGIGIPTAALGRVFEPFFTTRRGRGGTGLGLHITYNMVVGTFAGQIAVEPREGGGTRVRVEVPYRPATAIPSNQLPVEVTLDPTLPRALWVSFADDLRVRAATLRTARTAEQRRAVYHQLAGAVGVYGIHHLVRPIEQAHSHPSERSRALLLADQLDETATAIIAELDRP